MMKKEIYNNNFIKKINKNWLSSHKIYFCEECSLTPFLSLKYERNENNNFYNIFIKYSCDNNHENKIEITQFFQNSVKNKISKDKNPEFELSKYNKIKQKIESFSYNNIKLIKEIGVLLVWVLLYSSFLINWGFVVLIFVFQILKRILCLILINLH